MEVTKGSKQSGLQTAVGLSKKSQMQIRKLGLETKDFKTHKDRPLIELRGPKLNGKKGKRLALDITNPEVSGMLRELEEINQFFDDAQINYHGSNLTVDVRDRRIYRVFNESLTRYGLAVGGFWRNLKSQDRLDHLYIDDEPVTELDLKSACLQIAYGLAGSQLTGDFYAVPGLEALDRKQVKKLTVTYLNGGREAFKKPLLKSIYSRMCPDGDASNTRVLLRILSAIRDYHRPIADYFNPEKAACLVYVQGELILGTVLDLMKQRIVALPGGDAIYVKENARAKALQALQHNFEQKTGSKNKISLSS